MNREDIGARARRRSGSPLGGIALMTLSTAVFAAQDAVTKTLTATLPVGQIVCVRFAFFLAFACLLASRQGGVRRAFRSAVPGRQLLRCLLMCSEIALFAYALRFLGLAEIHALFACFPLVVAALSVPVLGERVGPRRWFAVLAGLAGTLIILRPGSAVFDAHALLPLVCAVIYALYNLLTRQVSRHDPFATSLVYFGLVGTCASLPFALAAWQGVTPREAALLLALCGLSVLGHAMLIKALQLTEAVVLQPFHYLVLPWAMILGTTLFGETLDAATIAGSLIVVGSGIYVAWREFVLSRTSTPSRAGTASRVGAFPGAGGATSSCAPAAVGEAAGAGAKPDATASRPG